MSLCKTLASIAGFSEDQQITAENPDNIKAQIEALHTTHPTSPLDLIVLSDGNTPGGGFVKLLEYLNTLILDNKVQRVVVANMTGDGSANQTPEHLQIIDKNNIAAITQALEAAPSNSQHPHIVSAAKLAEQSLAWAFTKPETTYIQNFFTKAKALLSK